MTGFLGVVLAVTLLAGCGAGDPRRQVQRARGEFEVKVNNSVPDRAGGRLLIEATLDKKGGTPLEVLTLRVEQRNPRGGVLRADHVAVDVSAIRAYQARQISLTVPLAEGEVHGLAVEVEPDPEPGVLYQEFEDLP